MPYMQVRDVLKHAAQFHARLADTYRWLEQRSEDPQKQRFLSYMARAEDDARRLLLGYIGESDSNALATWLHYIPPTTLDMADLPTPEMSLDDLVCAAVRLDRGLVQMYDRLSSYTSAPGTQDVLGRLRDLQAEKERKYSRAAFFEEVGGG